MSPVRLPLAALVSYALPSTLFLMVRAAAYGIIPALYAERFKLSLADIAGVLLTMRVIEACLQIPAGWLSDRLRHPRWGRKPMLFVGIVIAGVAICKVYLPPDGADLGYLSLWLIVATVAASTAEVGYGAWATEITSDYAERARVASFQTWGAVAGNEVFAVVPLLWFLSSNRVTFEALTVVAAIVAVLVPVTLLACSWYAPVGAPVVRKQRGNLKDLWDSVRDSKPVQRVLLIFALWEAAVGTQIALMFMYVDSFLKAGEAVPIQGLVGVWASMAGLLTLNFLLRRHEKHVLWAASIGVIAALYVMQGLLTPQVPGLVPILVACTCLTYFAAAGAVVVPMSVVGDLADYEAMRTGKRASGQLVAVLQLSGKLCAGAAGSAALYLLSLFAFEPGKANYSETEALGIKLLGYAVPAVLAVAAAALAWGHPITARRHRAILRTLARRGHHASPT